MAHLHASGILSIIGNVSKDFRSTLLPEYPNVHAAAWQRSPCKAATSSIQWQRQKWFIWLQTYILCHLKALISWHFTDSQRWQTAILKDVWIIVSLLTLDSHFTHSLIYIWYSCISCSSKPLSSVGKLLTCLVLCFRRIPWVLKHKPFLIGYTDWTVEHCNKEPGASFFPLSIKNSDYTWPCLNGDNTKTF